MNTLPVVRGALGYVARPGLGPLERCRAGAAGVLRLIRREHRQLVWLTSLALFVTR